MARDHGRIFSSIWSDRDFMAMSQDPQRFYIFLVTQSNLSAAGVLPVTARRWAASASDLTPGQVYDLLDELADRRFVVWDRDTEEVMIRTYLRYDKVYRQPNVMLKAVNDAAEIVSARIRLALLRELDRLPLDEVSDTQPKSGGPTARQTVAECIQTLHRTLFGADDKRAEPLSGRVPETLPGTPKGPNFEANPIMPQAETDEVLEVNEVPHASPHEPHEVTSAPEAWTGQNAQFSGGFEAPPEWVPGTLPDTPYARAFPLTPSPFPEPQDLPSSADADEPQRAPQGATRAAKKDPIPPGFEGFWKIWPRKVERKAAMRAFAKAVANGASPDAITASARSFAERYQRTGAEKKFIPHASTWLNGERWDDDLDDAVPLPGAPAPQAQPPRYGQTGSAGAPCRWCDSGLYERTDGRMARCDHPDQPPAGHPAAEPAGSAP